MVKSTLYLQTHPDRRVRRAAPDAGVSSSPELDSGWSPECSGGFVELLDNGTERVVASRVGLPRRS